jgi:integrase
MKSNAPCAAEVKKTRVAARLTQKLIESLRATPHAYRVPDARCRGLALRVAPSGLKTWDVAFRVRGAGVVRRLSLGPFPAVSLEAARQRTTEYVMAAQAGTDLVAEQRRNKEEASARITVANLISSYVQRRVHGRLRTATEIEARLKRALAGFADLAADDLRRRHIRELLDAVADRGALREAEKQRQLIGTMFRWAVGQDLVSADPTSGLSGYSMGQRRERVLSNEELPLLWGWLDELPFDYSAALRLQLCLGARIGEVAGIRADEIDQSNWLWTMPAARSKNKRARVTPVVGIARTIIAEQLDLRRAGALFFSEMGAVLSSQHVASMIVKRRKKDIPVPHFTSHDLRRTVATRLVELGVPYETTAAVLGHEVGGASVRVLTRHYLRSDLLQQKYAALSLWDAHLNTMLASLSPSFIVNANPSMPKLLPAH